MNYSTYIFDFDGTLADTSSCIVVSTSEALEYFGFQKVSQSEIRKHLGLRLDELFSLLGVGQEKLQDVIKVYKERYAKNSDKLVELFPGVSETLESLKDKTLVVASNKSKIALVDSLGKLGILNYFSLVFGGDDVINGKPNPEMLEKIFQLIKVNKGEAVMIGDTIFDLQLARNFGIPSIGVLWGTHTEKELKLEKPVKLLKNIGGLKLM